MIKHSGKGGAHYKENGEREVCEFMEDEAIDIFYSGFCTDQVNIKDHIKSALWAAMAVKHELRAGTKKGNSVDQDIEKSKNYRNRQKTGEWIVATE